MPRVVEGGEHLPGAVGEIPEHLDRRQATDWLRDLLTSVGGRYAYKLIKEEGRRAGHSIDSIKRARHRLKVVYSSEGFPRETYWTLPRQ